MRILTCMILPSACLLDLPTNNMTKKYVFKMFGNGLKEYGERRYQLLQI
jgi:hypothetical protein